jgi:phosphoglucosamine mutase
MIFTDRHTTGDGLVTALRLIEIMTHTGKPLSELASIMTVYPQILMNVPVSESRPDVLSLEPVADAVKQVERKLGPDGRVLIRYSGTQPLLRVMVEGPDELETRECCRQICTAIRNHTGNP